MEPPASPGQLQSPPYWNLEIRPLIELSYRLLDLMAIKKCTKYELEKAMRYYVRLMGQEADLTLGFWPLTSHFWKLLTHNPSKLPRGLLNPLLANWEIYEDAIWVYNILMDPEQMEIITEATQHRDQSQRSSQIDYPLTPSQHELIKGRITSLMISLLEKASQS